MKLAWLALLLAPTRETTLEVSVRRGLDRDELCTVRAEGAPVDRLLDRLADELTRLDPEVEVVVEGFEPLRRAALVTVELVDRPVPHVLEVVLGSVGLEATSRPGTLTVREARGEGLGAEELRAKSLAAYAHAAGRFPDHPRAPAARLEQGLIEEERGNHGAALAHFATLRESYRTSPLAFDATWRSAMVLQELGNWSEASLELRALTSSEKPHPYHAAARLEMARCATELGDAQRALHVLAALEESHPAASDSERVDRELVRATAYVGSGLAMQALRALADVVTEPLTARQRRSVFRLQAQAFEDLGKPAEAAWAWQVLAQQASGDERASALEQAARLSLAGDEDLHVLFLGRQAEDEGLRERLAPYVAEAQARLGLGADEPAEGETHAGTLRRARALLDQEDALGAWRLLEPLFAVRASFSEEQAAELYPLWSRVLERRRGLDAAIGMLRGARPTLRQLEHRRQLDLAASALFEEYRLFEQAADAYEGRY